MKKVHKAILQTKSDVDRCLEKLGVTKDELLQVVEEAMLARSSTTGYDTVNAPGLQAYMRGIRILREVLVGQKRKGHKWELDREDGVEGVVNSDKIKISFANVDIACNDKRPPQPISPKGAGSKCACSGNIRTEKLPLFPDLEPSKPSRPADYSLYYVMADSDGNAELSRPVIKNGGFHRKFRERIYLRKGMELKGEATPSTPKEPVSGDPNPTRTSK